EPVFEPEPAPMPEPVPSPAAAFEPEETGDVFELTADMVTTGVISQPTAQMSTDVLAELARAILDQRDLMVGNRDLTLESMMREMLKPLLKEWLDRNLPYLIERLVKKEIDLMINRAERLD
ncbi:MAG: DUF2497 domain-containing protein, partial [Rhodospirillales bacterium]|nr:DUF2497 domain-containing protein [Rhodospirillales bacterium]